MFDLPASIVRSLVLLLALVGCSGEASDPPAAADLVVLHGKVVTLDDRSTIAEAAAIRDGRFVRVGSDRDIRPWIGPQTRVLDAQGKSVLPGFIESHIHSLDVAEQEAVDPFVELGSIAEVAQWIRKRSAQASPGQWIRVPRIYPTRLNERRFPNRRELDQAESVHPVLCEGAYAQVLNSAALKAAGITRETPAPPGGEIERGDQGEPTGLLRNAAELTARFLKPPEIPEEAMLRSLEEVHRRYLAAGITSVGERWTKASGVALYAKLKAQGRLRVRAALTMGLETDGTVEGAEKAIGALALRPGEGDDWLRAGPLKIVVDGGILIGTAYLREPYGLAAGPLYGIKDPAYRGSLKIQGEAIKNILRTGHRLGWQLSCHVTGDAGVDLVLDAVEAADRDRPIGDRRFILIHAYFPNDETIRRAARLGVCVDTQPAWYYKDADAIVTALGEERLRHFIGVRGWKAGGVHVAINSDHMLGLDADRALNPFNPLLTMAVAITRRTEGGRVIGPEERVSREDALRMMTREAAYLTFDEGRKGSIEPGKLGDLVLLSGDFLACPEDEIKRLKVRATVVGGKVAFEGR